MVETEISKVDWHIGCGTGTRSGGSMIVLSWDITENGVQFWSKQRMKPKLDTLSEKQYCTAESRFFLLCFIFILIL